ncbi:hypothetical protein ACIRXL_06790 [Avibacterium paragallinarum]|uniref:hypothetical protein n=1 Tax=Avibacterium paragallinarum TaxID=728 RepID=UPI0021F75F63|nr:hypothetical protein [Avibacterium paragallinarum]UXN34599.1 hypothetical protein N8E86_11200 [Avibacterium paragallinarum]
MQQSHSSAIRAAGIGCALMLLLIALFTLPSSQIVDYLTLAGEWVGQGTTVGIFMLAALPSLTALLFYFIWKWLTK